MARARNIKPGFFKNEFLAEINPLGRILFAGLWCEADREGRLEDRPKRLKIELLPYDDCDVNELLTELEQFGFIVRYEVAGCKYIQINNFSRHQNPHKAEKASEIPAPEQHSDEENQGKHSASTVQEQYKHETKRADSLIPDPLNSDCLFDAPEAPSEQTSRSGSGGRQKKPKRGSQVDTEFRPDDDLLAWARGKAPGVDPDFETEKFINHHTAKGTIAKDWRASWRTWMLNAVQFQAARGGRAGKPPGLRRTGFSEIDHAAEAREMGFRTELD